MNCRKCEAHLSAFIDSELDPRTAGEVSRHLGSCSGCRESEASLVRLRDTLSGLPEYNLTQAEQDRLMSAVRQEMRQAREKKAVAHASLYPRIAAGTAILVAVVVVTLALMSTPVSHETATEEAPTATVSEEDAADIRNDNGAIVAGGQQPTQGYLSDATGSLASSGTNTLSMVPTPKLVTSTTDYDKAQVADYSKDLGTRLDFYSDVWYQPGTAGTASKTGMDQSGVREYCLSSLLSQAETAGEDPASLQAALSAVSSQKPSTDAIPCFVEKASYQGQPVWIISFSTPKDAQLFTNPEVASLVNLARQLYASGDLNPSDLMEGLTANMAPGSTYYSVSALEQEALGTGAIGLEELINELARDNNLISYLRQLAALDADKLVGLVARGSGFPVEFSSISSSLLDMLTWRVWVIGTEDGQVLARPSR